MSDRPPETQGPARSAEVTDLGNGLYELTLGDKPAREDSPLQAQIEALEAKIDRLLEIWANRPT